MNNNRVLGIAIISFVGLIVVCCILGLLLPPRVNSGASRSYQYAYEACRRTMLNTEGYGIWKLQNSQMGQFKAQFDFDDGWNIATCYAVGAGPFWYVTGTMQTLVGCAKSLSDTGGNECPRAKFGVNP